MRQLVDLVTGTGSVSLPNPSDDPDVSYARACGVTHMGKGFKVDPKRVNEVIYGTTSDTQHIPGPREAPQASLDPDETASESSESDPDMDIEEADSLAETSNANLRPHIARKGALKRKSKRKVGWNILARAMPDATVY